MKGLKNKLTKYFKKQIIQIYEERIGSFFFKQRGFCNCCDQEVFFIARNNWLRDHFLCCNCKSLPRERALMYTIQKEYPNWKSLSIHESSPGNRGHSIKLRKLSSNYLETQFFSKNKLGGMVGGIRNENLENQTFPSNHFDLVITSDVMEHVFNPEKAFREIHRTLKKGGAHIFSVPLVNKHQKTQKWAVQGKNGEAEFLFSPEWHGNPLNKKGSPVTMHWGYDIVQIIEKETGAECHIEHLDDLYHGIRAEFIEIIVAKKID